MGSLEKHEALLAVQIELKKEQLADYKRHNMLTYLVYLVGLICVGVGVGIGFSSLAGEVASVGDGLVAAGCTIGGGIIIVFWRGPGTGDSGSGGPDVPGGIG